VLEAYYCPLSTINKEKAMPQPVPDDYHNTVQAGSELIRGGANLVMWVAEMLGNDTFELETDKYHIIIKKRDENLISADV
jgi:hypothetical protein